MPQHGWSYRGATISINNGQQIASLYAVIKLPNELSPSAHLSVLCHFLPALRGAIAVESSTII